MFHFPENENRGGENQSEKQSESRDEVILQQMNDDSGKDEDSAEHPAGERDQKRQVHVPEGVAETKRENVAEKCGITPADGGHETLVYSENKRHGSAGDSGKRIGGTDEKSAGEMNGRSFLGRFGGFGNFWVHIFS